MAKKRVPIAVIYSRSEVPCIRSGKTDHVLDVAIGEYILPLHLTELWEEVKNGNAVVAGKNGKVEPDSPDSKGGS